MPRRLIALVVTLTLTLAAAPAAGRPVATPPVATPPVATPPVATPRVATRPASAGPAAVAPGEPGEWSPPVDGPVVRGFEAPARPFGPRHLGLDFAVPPGSPVRAAGDGVVVFAGRAGRHWAVAVGHPGGRRTTYAYLRRTQVTPGWPVRRGAVLGESGGSGPGHGPGIVHFGYRVNGRAEDPAPLFASPPPPRISLAPLDRPACPNRRSFSAPRR